MGMSTRQIGHFWTCPLTCHRSLFCVSPDRAAMYSCTGYALHNSRQCHVFRLEHRGGMQSSHSAEHPGCSMDMPHIEQLQCLYREPGNYSLKSLERLGKAMYPRKRGPEFKADLLCYMAGLPLSGPLSVSLQSTWDKWVFKASSSCVPFARISLFSVGQPPHG